MQENSEAEKLAVLFAHCSQNSYGISIPQRNLDGTLARDATGKVISEKDEHILTQAPLSAYDDHLAGLTFLGLVPTNNEGTTTVAGIDIDPKDYLTPPDGFTSHAKYWESNVSRFTRHRANVWSTRSGGARIAFMWRDPILTISARSYAKFVATSLLALPDTTEIFPKQDNLDGLGDDGKPKRGNYMFLPYFGEPIGEIVYSDPPPDVIAAQQLVDKKDAAYGLHIRIGIDPLEVLRTAGLKWREPTPESAGVFRLNYHVEMGKCLVKGSKHTTCGNEKNNRCCRFVWDSIRGLLYHQCFDSDCQAVSHPTKVALTNLGINLADLLDFTADYSDRALCDKWIATKPDVRYLDASKVWMVYDPRSGLWVKNHIGPREELGDFLKAEAPGIPAATPVDAVEDEAAALVAARAKLQARLDARLKSSNTISAVLYQAVGRHELKADISVFDPEHWVLGLPAGKLIDLRNKKVRPTVAADLLTKAVTVTPDFGDPALTCPRFEQFMKEVQPDLEIRGFLHRYAGYALTAQVSEEVLLMFIGVTGGGKNTYLRLFEEIFGPYYGSMSRSMLLASSDEAYRETEIGQLHGVRLGAISETSSSSTKTFDSNFLKDITGGGKLRGRSRYEDSKQFQPQLKPLIIANKAPQFDDIDDGLKRRIRVVKWEKQFGGTTGEDLNLSKKLQAEYPGILAQFINGCILWQKMGLCAPQAVKTANTEYFIEADQHAKFIAECTEIVPKVGILWGDKDAFTPTMRLYKSWRIYCTQNGYGKSIVGTVATFTVCLREKAKEIEHDRANKRSGGSGFWGIKLNDYGNSLFKFTEAEMEKVHGN